MRACAGKHAHWLLRAQVAVHARVCKRTQPHTAAWRVWLRIVCSVRACARLHVISSDKCRQEHVWVYTHALCCHLFLSPPFLFTCD